MKCFPAHAPPLNSLSPCAPAGVAYYFSLLMPMEWVEMFVCSANARSLELISFLVNYPSALQDSCTPRPHGDALRERGDRRFFAGVLNQLWVPAH